ncbi:MAG: NTP transferase domain-containing protein [Defluviimonas sp.]|nr:NTP transferase domain-containing protein [Defluviimonas sp.]
MPQPLAPRPQSVSTSGGAGGGTLAVLLAGGKGSRLHELTASECKPALFFAGNRRIVDFALANALRSGLHEMIACTQYRPETLTRHLQGPWGAAFGAAGGRLDIAHGPEVAGHSEGYLGTADAVMRNIPAIDARAPRHVVVMAADHVCQIDFRSMIETHVASGAEATVAAHVVPRSSGSEFGILGADARGRATGFVEKPSDPPGMPEDPAYALASMGIYVFNWPWLRARLLADAADGGSGHDFGHDILPAAVREGVVGLWRLAAQGSGCARPYWRDVGTLDSYRVTQLDFTCAALPCAMPESVLPQAGAALAPSAGPRPRGGLRPGAAWPGPWPDESVILPGGSVASGARVTRAIVAPGAHVPSGLVIGEDAQEDARWFRRSAGGTVLVTRAMLARREAQAARPVPVRLPAALLRPRSVGAV